MNGINKLHKNFSMTKLAKAKTRVIADPWYTLRRYYVDVFFTEFFDGLDATQKYKVLDIGGIRNNKRGEFNIADYNLDVEYVNIDPGDEPDYLCDLTKIPVPDNQYDIAILAEVLEHVNTPYEALVEAFRVLKPGGKLIITTPFMYHVHGDPQDFARYTGYWYQENLAKAEFQQIDVRGQGGFWGVVANIAKIWRYNLAKDSRLGGIRLFIANKFVDSFIKKALSSDDYYTSHKVLGSFTTGFGVIAVKPN
jgi:SAM-dependent methyltransferase